MTEAETTEIVAWLEAREATYQVNGGWAVDALLGRQTRQHRDLDIVVDAQVIGELLAWLDERDYVVAEDWLPIRIELVARHGRVDVHPMTIQANGDGIQRGFGDETFRHAAKDRTSGVIGGGTVVVASAARLRKLREGYAHRNVDLHDLAILEISDQTHRSSMDQLSATGSTLLPRGPFVPQAQALGAPQRDPV